MYSYEDRMRAVKLYIKLGKRANATIRHSLTSKAPAVFFVQLSSIAPESTRSLHFRA